MHGPVFEYKTMPFVSSQAYVGAKNKILSLTSLFVPIAQHIMSAMTHQRVCPVDGLSIYAYGLGCSLGFESPVDKADKKLDWFAFLYNIWRMKVV